MVEDLNEQERRLIRQGIREKYVKVAVSPQGLFKYPTGRAGLEALGYDPDLLRSLPDASIDSYCGVGNPFPLGTIHKGEAVLDIGCGAGVDSFMAALMVGATGRVVGIDMTPDMVDRAASSAKDFELQNITFRLASAEDLPFPGESFDVVVSNGVFNLIPDKPKALREVYRTLKPGGRLMMADQVLISEPDKDKRNRIDTWAQ